MEDGGSSTGADCFEKRDVTFWWLSAMSNESSQDVRLSGRMKCLSLFISQCLILRLLSSCNVLSFGYMFPPGHPNKAAGIFFNENVSLLMLK